MSLAIAVPLGIASSVVYGCSIVAQHRAAHEPDAGADARRLLSLLRDPRWLLAMGGDFVGFLLNVAALATGPVVIIQPLVVLMLPVAMAVGAATGGPRPRRADHVAAAAILLGLAGFLVLIGTPGAAQVPGTRVLAGTVAGALAAGAVLALAVGRGRPVLRGAAYGVVAGLYFGTLGVLVDAASVLLLHGGYHDLLTSGRGIVSLLGILLLGAGGIALTQVSFQVGALAATLPANLAADPLSAVAIGAVLLHEHLPLSAPHLFGYAACLVAVAAGAIRLAAPAVAEVVDPA